MDLKSPHTHKSPALALATKVETDEASRIHRIRITLTSLNVENLEKVCADLKRGAVDKKLRVAGPVRLPTKKLKRVPRLRGETTLARRRPRRVTCSTPR